MRGRELTALLGLSALSMALGASDRYHDVRYHRDIRPLRHEDSKSKAKLVGSKRSKRRNKAKGRTS